MNSLTTITNSPVMLEGLESLSEQSSITEVVAVKSASDDSVIYDWTLDEAAKSLKLSRGAVLRRIETGQLSGYQIRRPFGIAWRIKPILDDGGQSIDAKTIATSDVEQVLSMVSNEAETMDELKSLISIFLEKLTTSLTENAAHRIGYLEAKLETQEQEINLLNEYKLKAANAIVQKIELESTQSKMTEIEQELAAIKHSSGYKLASQLNWFFGLLSKATGLSHLKKDKLALE